MIEQEFQWSRLGNIETGRGNLGSEAPVEMYRLLQYTIFDELSHRYGNETAENIYRSAGFRAGLAFSQNIIERKEDFYD
ncbi:MAG: 4-vinyl reductase, partial [Gracilibacteraceae bacterium]|nr:4-vinyl reductase [Gracilibacteraceae bacterium]